MYNRIFDISTDLMSQVEERVKKGDEFDGIFEMHSTAVKHIYMVDAGLTFNSPYPLILRPQREVDIILSFDFSARQSDQTQPFKVSTYQGIPIFLSLDRFQPFLVYFLSKSYFTSIFAT